MSLQTVTTPVVVLLVGIAYWFIDRNDCAAAESDMNFARLAEQVREIAKQPYEPDNELPVELRQLNYDTYRLITFRHEKAIWKKEALPFWLEAFHRGYLFKDKVELNLLDPAKGELPLKFSRDLFQYRGDVEDLSVGEDVGFAGWRVIGKFENSEHPLEIASFLGASYFRAIGEGQVYGSSARGLAIDIGMPKAEEFPVFSKYWIEQPKPGDKSLKLLALLDSASVAGAYEMVLTPGKTTTIDVKVKLFFRKQPDKVGLAPITSMWMWGDEGSRPSGDDRPHVHDSDGLLIHTQNDEWIWRSLGKQAYPSVSHYDMVGVKGFGLIQRDRDFMHYQDEEAKYDKRPNVWIEPRGEWPPGAIELLELPAEHEGVDNVGAYWSLKQVPTAGESLELEYRISFSPDEPEAHRLAKATEIRVLRNTETNRPEKVEIEFAGESLSTLTDLSALKSEITGQRGEVSNPELKRLSANCVQLGFDITPDGDASMELEAQLIAKGKPLTEKWRYLCPN